MTQVATFTAPALPQLAVIRDRSVHRAEQVDQAISNGYETGYTRGFEQAQAEAQQHIESLRQQYEHALAGLNQATQALESAIAQLESTDAVALEHLEHHAVQLATHLATDIVGHEVSTADSATRNALQRASGLVPARGVPHIHVHPADVQQVHDAIADGPVHPTDPWPWADRFELIPNPNIEPGGCVVEIGDCEVDAQVGPALERMQRTMSSIYSELRQGSVRPDNSSAQLSA